jgi:hypothetical protein
MNYPKFVIVQETTCGHKYVSEFYGSSTAPEKTFVYNPDGSLQWSTNSMPYVLRRGSYQHGNAQTEERGGKTNSQPRQQPGHF